MNNYFGIGIDAKISLDFHHKREEHPEKCRSRTRNYMWYGVLGSKQWLQVSLLLKYEICKHLIKIDYLILFRKLIKIWIKEYNWNVMDKEFHCRRYKELLFSIFQGNISYSILYCEIDRIIGF